MLEAAVWCLVRRRRVYVFRWGMEAKGVEHVMGDSRLVAQTSALRPGLFSLRFATAAQGEA